ncbi:MAG TPA: glycosyltransferase family 39 protein [Gaiellaceae bacterium]|nr:glycosyltransferase family 39 protein [Gaiellaceae bacterium]
MFGRHERLERLAVWPVLVVVAARSALELAVAGRYGWQRDELYYAVAGRHLQGGYVEFPPVTALVSALARVFYGWSLVGFRSFVILAGALVTVTAALVARELGGSRYAQLLAAVLVGFAPILLITNNLFQPVSFDQLTTMVVLWLALRLARGRGSWPLLGLAIGVGLETKYTLAVVLASLVAGFAVWRRDALEPRGLLLAAGIAVALMIPNLLWEATHTWTSVRFFLNPPPSASDESRPQYFLNVVFGANPVAFPVAVAGAVALFRDLLTRPVGFAAAAVVPAYFLLGGKSYYAAPAVLFALAAGALPLERWATARRLWLVGTAFALFTLGTVLTELPTLPLHTADRHGIIAGRSDFESETSWHWLVPDVERLAAGADVVIASNYGEAGALQLFGHGLPAIASGDVTMRYWRPKVTGRHALLIGFDQASAGFCHDYRLVARLHVPVHSDEQSAPIATCSLNGSLADVWPEITAQSD